MILLLKISLILVLLLLIFTRYSCNIKIYAGAIFIFLLILLYQSHSCTFETICLSLLGIIYIITLSKFYPILISTRKRINSSLVFLISSALCLTTSFVFLDFPSSLREYIYYQTPILIWTCCLAHCA